MADSSGYSMNTILAVVMAVVIVIGGGSYALGKSAGSRDEAESSNVSYSGGQIVGIVIGSVLGVMSLIGGVIYGYDKYVNAGAASFGNLAIATGGKTLYYFIPYALFLFGILHDAVNGQLRFSPAGFIGLAAVFLNYFLSYGLSKPEDKQIRDSDICGIPGMSSVWSRISPQNILFSTTVLTYIISTTAVLDNKSTNNIITAFSLVTVFFVQLFMYFVNGCHNDVNRPWKLGSMSLSGIFPPLIALASGMLFGGLFGFGFTTLILNKKAESDSASGDSASSVAEKAAADTKAALDKAAAESKTAVEKLEEEAKKAANASVTNTLASSGAGALDCSDLPGGNALCTTYTDGTLVKYGIVS